MAKELFDILIMPLTSKMYRYALSILRSPENAHDVVQECLIKIWKKKDLLGSIDHPEAWAMRITRNQCYDWVKVNRFNLYELKEHDLENQHTPDASLIFTDHQAWLDKIIDKLPAKHREVFHLREVEEMSYQDIADVLSISLSEVKISLFRTRTRIKEMMEKIESYGLAK